MATQPPTPKEGDIRINDDDKVEYYDGTGWVLHEELPDDLGEADVIMRADHRGDDLQIS
ncbi:hypothetical protein ABTW95_24605 [Spirillospora sp. NPDC127506]|jgi:hypothetical protein